MKRESVQEFENSSERVFLFIVSGPRSLFVTINSFPQVIKIIKFQSNREVETCRLPRTKTLKESIIDFKMSVGTKLRNVRMVEFLTIFGELVTRNQIPCFIFPQSISFIWHGLTPVRHPKRLGNTRRFNRGRKQMDKRDIKNFLRSKYEISMVQWRREIQIWNYNKLRLNYNKLRLYLDQPHP